MESCSVFLPCDRSDWSKIATLIRGLCNARSIDQASQTLRTISQQVHGAEDASVPHRLVEEFLLRSATEDEQRKIVRRILPVIANAAESLKKLKPNWQISKERSAAIASTSAAVNHDLLVSVIAHCVLCTIPLSKQAPVHPLITFLSRSDGQLSRTHVAEKLRCIFKFFEEVNDRGTISSQIVYKHKFVSSKEQLNAAFWLDSAIDLCPIKDATHQDEETRKHVIKLRTTEHISKGVCICPLLLPISLFLQPIGVDEVLEIYWVDNSVFFKGHGSNLTIIGEPTGKAIGLEEQDSVYHDAVDQSDASVESDYETAPETHDNFLSPYELVSGYSNSLSKAITNCAIYDAVRSKKLRRDSDDSHSSQNSSNSSNRSNPRDQASFTETGQTSHNLAQYYCQDTDRLHVNLLRRRSSNELSSHHSTSLSEFGSEMDEYFGKKISAITEDDSQPHVEDFAMTLASRVMSHGLNTASLLIPGIQQFEAKQPVNVAMRPIALRPTPESITPELSSDGDHSSQLNTVEQFAQNIVEQSLSILRTPSDYEPYPTEKVSANNACARDTRQHEDISYKQIEKLASCLVEKLIDDVMQKKRINFSDVSSPDKQKVVFDEQERACFIDAVDQLAGRVVNMAVQDAQDIINDRLDLYSYGSINEEEYSIISPMSSLQESDSYEFIKIDSISEASSSSPVIVTKKHFSVEEYVEKILNESFAEIRNFKCGRKPQTDGTKKFEENMHLCQENKAHTFDATHFSKMVIDAALQKLNKLKSSNGSSRNLGDLGCLATCSAVNSDQSKVNGNEFRQNHKLQLPQPSANMVHDKVCDGNLIRVQETKGRDVRYVNTMLDRNSKASMSDNSENLVSGENSGPTPGTPPPTPNSLTKNNFDISENSQHELEEELWKRFAVDDEPEPEPSCKITSIDGLASKLASAAVSDGIHKVCRREWKPSSASTFTEDLLKIGNIDITGKRPSCTEENIAIFREELRRASIEQEKELERRGSQLSDFADELESVRFKEDLEEIPNHIQDFAYELANNILASAFREQFDNIERTEKTSEPTVDTARQQPTPVSLTSEPTVDNARQQPGPVSLDPAAQERNLLAMATNLANSIVASALEALRGGQAARRLESREQAECAEASDTPSRSKVEEDETLDYWNPQMKPMMLWLSASQSQLPGAPSSVDAPKLRKVCRTVLERGWNVGDLVKIVKDYTELPQADKSEELFDYILRVCQTT